MKTAVVVMAYGSPGRLEDVPAYFADIRGGRPVRPEAVEELVGRYRRVGISPLNRITEAQRAALEAELGLPVYAGMKHWEPRIAEAARRATGDGADHVVGLVLAPHYSRMSVGGYRERLEAALDGTAKLTMIESWHDHSPFLDLVADRLRAAGLGRETHVVFTAHSLPERILAERDPYRDQLLETARCVAGRLELPGDRWSFAFQSASPTGEPWLGPDVLDHLADLHARGVRKVLLAPIGFVADHLEILWDLDVEAREKAQALGVELKRIESMNDDPRFASALADLVRSRTT
ncbi:MAG TPA: ferrochelatase [Gaiellaceae bacterium]|jgi:ferrochelatase|nr:ferrochelatase [Gaiellaceae bacterium]